MTPSPSLPHGARIVQELLDGESRPVPASLRDTANDDLGTGGVARARYTSRSVHDLEVAKVWSKVWQMACREEQIPAVGDSIVYDVAGFSLIVVRRGPDEIRAFHNSCLHRGTRLRTQPGPVAELRCPFHGFTWNLDGSFAGMPCPWDFPHVDTARFCLPEARVGTWGGFVFVNLDEGAEPLESYLEILPDHFAGWPLQDRYLTAHVVRPLPCNWKVALEAFIESYHTVAVHPQLLKTSGDTQTEYDVYPGIRHVSRMITPVGIASEHMDGEVAEQDIVDAMFLTRHDPDATVPDGATARHLLAARMRDQLSEATARDYSAITDCEALDAIEYFVFPNFMPWAGYTTPLVYRFRPLGSDHTRSLMDVMLLEPWDEGQPPAGTRPHPPPGRRPVVGRRPRARLPRSHPEPGHGHHGPRPTGSRGPPGTGRDPGPLPGEPHPPLPPHPRFLPRGVTGSGAAGRPAPSYWPAATGEPVHDTTVADILRQAADAAPQVTALVQGSPEPDRRRRWSYRELAAEAEGAALALAARFDPGERVAVWAPSVPESLILTYAAAMAGVVLVPVNPALRAAEVAHILRQSGAAGVFLVPEFRDHDLAGTLGSIEKELPGLRHVGSLTAAGWREFCADSDADAPGTLASRAPSGGDVAQLIYTSGTTGVPKGALLTHRGMTNAARFGAVRFGMGAGDVYVHTMPLHHVGGQVVAFQICQQRATAVLLESFDPGLVLELIEAERGTLTCGVPTMLLAMIEHPDRPRRDLSSLRAVSGGGAVVPTELIGHIQESLAVRFTVVFGQTEASGFISQTELDDSDEEKAASLGRPLPAVEARVIDPDSGEVVPTGVVGELQVRGPNVMAGYHGLAVETAEALSDDGWLRTGDLVTMDVGGILRMKGRCKEMIVSGGENLFPVEIENVLSTHPAVAQAAVVGVPDRLWGEAAVAFVRPLSGAVVDGVVLEGFLRQHLAAFKVPRRWVFVDSFPLTASGKIQKFVLRQRLEAGAD